MLLRSNEVTRCNEPALMRERFAELQGDGQTECGSARRLQRSKATSGLEKVYRAAELPPFKVPKELRAEKRRIVAEGGLEPFVQGLYWTASRVPEHRWSERQCAVARQAKPALRDDPPGRAAMLVCFF
jgi:hypothetical protein